MNVVNPISLLSQFDAWGDYPQLTEAEIERLREEYEREQVESARSEQDWQANEQEFAK